MDILKYSLVSLLVIHVQVMMRKLIDSKVDVENRVRALPLDDELWVGDFFSGAGTLMLIMDAITKAIGMKVPGVGTEFDDPWTT